MSRLTLLRIGWVLAVASLFALAILIWHKTGRRAEILVLMAVVALIPGRIQGSFFRDLFTGRRLMGAKRFEDAIGPLSAFVDQARARPFYCHLIWLGWPGFSISPLAMALNNRGGCHLELGSLDRAERDLHEAIKVDELSPLPYLNLAMIEALNGHREEAQRLLGRAAELGFRGNRLDRFQIAVSSVLARVEGRSEP